MKVMTSFWWQQIQNIGRECSGLPNHLYHTLNRKATLRPSREFFNQVCLLEYHHMVRIYWLHPDIESSDTVDYKF